MFVTETLESGGRPAWLVPGSDVMTPTAVALCVFPAEGPGGVFRRRRR